MKGWGDRFMCHFINFTVVVFAVAAAVLGANVAVDAERRGPSAQRPPDPARSAPQCRPHDGAA